MRKFVTKRVDEIKAREIVEQLVIDEIGVLDELKHDISGTTFKTELYTLIKYIEHFANGQSVGGRMKYLKGNDGCAEYEFTTKHLRIYVIQQPNSKLIIYGGTKRQSDSSDNIKAFRLLKEAYLKSINKKNEKGRPA